MGRKASVEAVQGASQSFVVEKLKRNEKRRRSRGGALQCSCHVYKSHATNTPPARFSICPIEPSTMLVNNTRLDLSAIMICSRHTVTSLSGDTRSIKIAGTTLVVSQYDVSECQHCNTIHAHIGSTRYVDNGYTEDARPRRTEARSNLGVPACVWDTRRDSSVICIDCMQATCTGRKFQWDVGSSLS